MKYKYLQIPSELLPILRVSLLAGLNSIMGNKN